MGTRSTIALEFADGTVEQIYCHWDGYLEHNGQILAKHYSDPFKLRDLIDQGDLSSLGPNIGFAHPFSPHASKEDEALYEAAKEAGACTFYARDRGETGTGAKKFKDLKDYYEHCQGEEYDYILSPRNGKPQWYVRFRASEGNWIPIEHAFELYSIAEEN